jgi:hypothetical protein
MALLAVVPACGTTERSEVTPGIGLYLDDEAPSYAFVPGTTTSVYVKWAASCTTQSPFGEGTTTEPCDEQDFHAWVSCTGAPCEIDPPAAETGIAIAGERTIKIVASSPGDLTIDVMIENDETHEQLARRGQMAIRSIERLVIDCVHQAYDPTKPRCMQRQGYVECTDVPWTACPVQTTVDPMWGTPVSMWVYGEGGGLPIATTTTIPVADHPLRPTVQFTGLTLAPTDYTLSYAHTIDAAAAVASKFSDDLKTAGTLITTARQDGRVVEAVMQLTAP